MALTALRPRVHTINQWRLGGHDRLCDARYEATLFFRLHADPFAGNDRPVTGPDGRATRKPALELPCWPAR